MHRSLLICCLLCWQPLQTICAEATVDRREVDLLIVGGTESGWAAAIQAARLGVPSIAIVHDGKWLGGQFTEQALACVDENKGVGKVGWGVDWHPMKRSFHRSGLFQELMERIESHNTSKYGSPMPGRPYHGPSTFRPAEAARIFADMLQPYIDSGQVSFVKDHFPVRADVSQRAGRPRLNGLWFAKVGETQPDLHVRAAITIDASDWGEAIQVCGAAFECGPDPQSRYGEASAPADLSNNPPNEMNPITWAMIVVESSQETPIPRPPRFDDRNYPRATHLSLNEFRSLEWDNPNPGLGAISHWPDGGKASERQLSVYTVRRIVDGRTSKTGRTMILLNYMNGQDYPLERLPQVVVDALEATEPGASKKNIVRMTRAQRELVFQNAKDHAKGVLYHLQNFVHDRAPDKSNSFRRFHLSDEFGTADKLPPKPYIRESLRLKAMYMMREQDGRNRDGATKDAARERFAHVLYPDGLFAWQFHYDFHRTGRTYLTAEGNRGPWIDFHKPNRHTRFLSDRSLFPLRSLIPEEMDGLIGAQKNVGYTSIVSAAIRLHDQCIAVGQAAGAIATIALRTGEDPRQFPYDRTRLERVRHALCGEAKTGTPLLIWPYRDLPTNEPAFVAINRLAAMGALPIDPRGVDFQPRRAAEMSWRQQVVRKSSQLKQLPAGLAAPTEPMSRGEFCRKWWQTLEQYPTRPWQRASADDADADGIPDRDDALLFTPNTPIRFEVETVPLTAQTDGMPTPGKQTVALINFCGSGGRAGRGYVDDHGQPFNSQIGRGWQRDLRSQHRRRNVYPELSRDTFVFTRTRDVWEYDLTAGKYRVTVCVGDSAYPQNEQRVVVEGNTCVDDVTTRSGQFAEHSVVAAVSDGRLTIEIGSGKTDSNTCLNWVQIENVD